MELHAGLVTAERDTTTAWSGLPTPHAVAVALLVWSGPYVQPRNRTASWISSAH